MRDPPDAQDAKHEAEITHRQSGPDLWLSSRTGRTGPSGPAKPLVSARRLPRETTVRPRDRAASRLIISSHHRAQHLLAVEDLGLIVTPRRGIVAGRPVQIDPVSTGRIRRDTQREPARV